MMKGLLSSSSFSSSSSSSRLSRPTRGTFLVLPNLLLCIKYIKSYHVLSSSTPTSTSPGAYSSQHSSYCYQRGLSFKNLAEAVKDVKTHPDLHDNLPTIQWYPGHIAKAEKQLTEYLKHVDVVIEVRDCRIPISTTHPLVPKWIGNKPVVIAMLRVDQVPSDCIADWKKYFSIHPPYPNKPNTQVYFVNAKEGIGSFSIKKEALKIGQDINQKRKLRGINSRPVRAAVIGFPNVGKSALINKILNKRLAVSMDRPGVTRQLQWVRLGSISDFHVDNSNVLELLDSPGIIPATKINPKYAMMLAICNDIGGASYDSVEAGLELCRQLKDIYNSNPNYINMAKINDRYKIAFMDLPPDDILAHIRDRSGQQSLHSAADILLSDFRHGRLGPICFEPPPFNVLISPSKARRNSKDEMRQSGKNEFHVEEKRGLTIDASDKVGGKYDGW